MCSGTRDSWRIGAEQGASSSHADDARDNNGQIRFTVCAVRRGHFSTKRLKPKTQNPKPKTQNPKPKTQNPKPKT